MAVPCIISPLSGCCWKVAGSPVTSAVSSSLLTTCSTALLEVSTMLPWVMTTWPVYTPVPLLLLFGSLLKSPWSARTLIGWFLSLERAQTPPAAKKPQSARASSLRLFLGDIVAFHIGSQHHTVILHVAVHAHPGLVADTLGHDDAIVGGGEVGVQVHGHPVGIDYQRGSAVLVRMGQLHVAVQVYQFAAARLDPVVGPGVPGRALLGEITYTRLEDLDAVIVRMMDHPRRLELRFRPALEVQVRDRGVGKIIIGHVSLGLLLLQALQRRLPQQPPAAGRQQYQEAQERQEFRVHARPAWAAMIRSQTSRTAPQPPVARVTCCARAFTSSRALGTATASPARSSNGRSGRSSPTQAASSALRPSFFRSRSKIGSLCSSPWKTWATPRSCMRRETAADSRDRK